MFSLSEVKLERFNAAFKPTPIPQQRFNVLIGRNGSGKSTVLEALRWIDTAIRRDAREACTRYWGIRDLISLRSRTDALYFNLTLTRNGRARYDLRVADADSASGRLKLANGTQDYGRNRAAKRRQNWIPGCCLLPLWNPCLRSYWLAMRRL